MHAVVHIHYQNRFTSASLAQRHTFHMCTEIRCPFCCVCVLLHEPFQAAESLVRSCQIQVGLRSHNGRVQLLRDAQLFVSVLDSLAAKSNVCHQRRSPSALSAYIPIFTPVHVPLIQVAEQLKAVIALGGRLEGALPHAHRGHLIVLLVQAQTALNLHERTNERTSLNIAVVNTPIEGVVRTGSPCIWQCTA